MKIKLLTISFTFFLMISTCGLLAQEAIPATGGNASGSGGTASYSIGQMVYSTNTGTTGSIAQGVQQPYEISVVSEIKEVKSINLECTVYPNPTNDFLTLKVENFDNENWFYQLIDIKGNLIERKEITGNETHINAEILVPANYFLKIIDNQKELKTFKIIKIQ